MRRSCSDVLVLGLGGKGGSTTTQKKRKIQTKASGRLRSLRHDQRNQRGGERDQPSNPHCTREVKRGGNNRKATHPTRKGRQVFVYIKKEKPRRITKAPNEREQRRYKTNGTGGTFRFGSGKSIPIERPPAHPTQRRGIKKRAGSPQGYYTN